MVEKNKNKLNAKKHRVFFEGKLGTISYRSKKDYNRQVFKLHTRKEGG